MDLFENPFYLLRATPRDGRELLVERADERALTLDPELCARSRSDLTNPRKRLCAEVAWLPGVGPKRTNELLELVRQHPLSISNVVGLCPLALANVRAAAMLRLTSAPSADQLADWMCRLTDTFETIDAEEVLSIVNEDRTVSRMPPIADVSLVEEELAARRRHYRSALRTALDAQPSCDLVRAVTIAVDRATESGTTQAGILIDDLVDSYEIETKEFLDRETENIHKLVAGIRTVAEYANADDAVDQLVEQLEAVTTNWDRVAQPLQLSAKSRGLEHLASQQVAFHIRNLSVDLWNEYEDLDRSHRLTAILQRVFAEVPVVDDRIREDADALRGLHAARERSKAEHQKWCEEIRYSATIGWLDKKEIRISEDGIDWNGRRYPLDAVTRVMWGGIQHADGRGPEFHVSFGDDSRLGVVTTRNRGTYAELTGKLWKAVCVRLLVEFTSKAGKGVPQRFGDVTVFDAGAVLRGVPCNWSEINVRASDGNLCLGCARKGISAALSYLNVPNVHLLETAVRALQRQGRTRISELSGD